MQPVINKKFCKLCDNCVEFCPLKNLKNDGNEIKFLGKCSGCRMCEKYCPEGGIRIEKTCSGE